MAEPEVFEFRTGERGAVVGWMQQLTVAGRGWLNVEAGIHDDAEVPARSLLLALFSSWGPDAPLLTWVPPRRTRRGVKPAEAGIRHGAGPRAVDRLAGQGIEVPDGWEVVQDHPGRGLVLTLPDAADPDEVLSWLLSAAEALSTLPLSGWWRASVYTG